MYTLSLTLKKKPRLPKVLRAFVYLVKANFRTAYAAYINNSGSKTV
jgi:hypothetical protein